VVLDNTGATILDVESTLARFGTYSGSGSDAAPNLNSAGTCETAPNGVVYATGHYLNYASIQSTQLPTSCDNRTIVIKHGTWNGLANGPAKKYKLIANIIGSSVASQEPGVGTAWQQYWSLLPQNDPTAITFEIAKTGKLVATSTGRDGWAVGIASLSTNQTFTCTVDGTLKTQALAIGYYSWDLYYAMTAAVPNTQRQAFYEALKPVIQGASASVNFGFMTYNPMNQGALVGMDILSDEQSKDPNQVRTLIERLPSMANCTRNANNPSLWDCNGVSAVIRSGPNRPQSEALYDAGYYFMAPGLGASYKKTDGSAPNKQNINVTTHVPNPNLCGYNHIIFLTNGLPNQDTNTPNLGDWDGDGREILNNSGSTTYGLGTHLLDDVAAYLKNKVDLREFPDGTKGGGITTHVILAFQGEDPLLHNTANAGGGEFYNVFNTEGLSNALLNILANIVREADTSFVAPVVPASSTNRTRSGERVYLGLFKPQTNANWHGNLKKYKLNTTNDLQDQFGNTATNADGDFIPATQSFWGTGPSLTDPTKTVLRGADGDRDILATGGSNAGDGGFVNVGGVGGTLLAMPDLRARNIFTIVGGSKTPLWDATATPKYRLNPYQLGFSDDLVFSVEENLKRSQLIDFLYGFDSYGVTYAVEGQVVPRRNWILGDILHSKPLVRSYWPFALENEGVCQYSEMLPNVTGHVDAPYNSTMIFVGTNDGLLHAFRDCDGSEAWAFVPPILLNKLQNLADGTHEFYVDASPVSYVYDADNDGRIEDGDKVFLIFGMRRGGGISYLTPNEPRGAYYILEVTDPENPQYRGEVSSNNLSFSELGETWSQPVIDWIKDGTTAKLAMFIGAGYDNNEDLRWGNTQTFPLATWSNDGNFANDTDTTKPTPDGEYNGGSGVTSAGTELTGRLNPKGRGLYIVELARINPVTYALETTNAGSLIKAFTADNTAGMDYSFPNDLTVLDWEGSDFVDRIYAADTGGQLWRIDVKDTDPSTPSNDKDNWTARVIFKANPGYTEGSPDNTNGRKFFYRPDVGKDGADAIVLIGSGDREHPLNRAVKDRLYMIRDKGQASAATEANLKDLTANRLQESSNLAEVETILTELNSATNYGWYVRLENGEKMLAEPVLFFGDVLYTTYTPKPPAQDKCEVGNLGNALLYHMDSLNATAVVNYCNAGTAGWERCLSDNDGQYNSLDQDSMARGKEGEVLLKADRVVKLGEGIPSGIVPLIDKTGKVSLKIAASGRLTDVKGDKVNTYYPLYWTETILK
jgi:type IV pilus assembly protein PilY1